MERSSAPSTKKGLAGAADAVILERARRENWVVLTHDSDFGLLVIRQQVPFFGVIFLRPGHVNVAFSLESLATRRDAALDLEPPFLLGRHAQQPVGETVGLIRAQVL